MRDPARIGRIMLKPERAWVRNPDWRLGQLLVNIMLTRGQVADTLAVSNIFHLEDSRLEDMLDAFLAEREKNSK